jgi:hypothetical protein
MSKTAITSPELTLAVGPFSQAIEVGGFLYFSGQVAQARPPARWSRGALLQRRSASSPGAFPPRVMRQSTGPGGNPQFRFDRKIRTFRFGNST